MYRRIIKYIKQIEKRSKSPAYCSARYKAGDFHNPVKRPNPCKLKGFGGSRNDQFKAWIQAILSIPLQYTCYYKERSDNNTAYQAYQINIGIDMKGGWPVCKAGGKNGQLFFVLLKKQVHIIGKGGPYSCYYYNNAAFDPAVCRKISGSQKYKPYSGHENDTDNIAVS